ncbi:Golgi-associated plant pathogenesis-related protein 1-like [Thunnus albacares]|uniref:Golgi-associated plant pathogenesis-related protein 1-like n=1 Tax=Thunnus albacares TaxID=8236 RepID=UPI001CF6C0DD|nr:Golgi-associated plant pathogenesis-related protein 1-like [Thunnus albacares]
MSFSTDASFKREFLETHNAYRAKHGAQPLTYNSELNAAAQKWADHLLQTGSMKHSKSGENIFNKWTSAPLKLTGKEAVESWYNEIKDYNWSRPGYSDSTGHFTQVVWKESTELGVGLATDGNNVFVVGQYRPPGNMNMPGYFEKNVLPQGYEEQGGMLGKPTHHQKVTGWADASWTSPGSGLWTIMLSNCGAVAVHSLLVTVWLH